MVRVFDEADYRRRLQALEANDDISIGEELGLIARDVFIHGDFRELNARKQINVAKAEALRQARKEMIAAIRAEDDKRRNDAIIPIDVQEIATGGRADDLVKVP